MTYIVYDAETGEILRGSEGENHSPLYIASKSISPNEIVMEGYYDASIYYVDVANQEIVEKPRPQIPSQVKIAGDDEDLLSVEVPAGTTVVMRDNSLHRSMPGHRTEWAVDDGIFEWSSTKVGLYTFEFFCPFPWASYTEIGVTVE